MLGNIQINQTVNPSSGCLERLIIFTRYPEAGKTKKRMIPLLGEKGAADLHRHMTEYTLKKARNLLSSSKASLEVYFTGGNLEKMQNWLGADLIYQLQGEGNLGDRMNQAFARAFSKGVKRVVIIGTDCPDVTEDLLIEAFDAIKTHTMVLGPATDGGYYLIGLTELFQELFREIAWGTGEVFQKTCQAAQVLSISLAYLPSLSDVDRPEDYPIWESHFDSGH